MDSICITGGTGFFGRALTYAFLRQTTVRRICIYSRGEHVQAAMRAKLSKEDLLRVRFFVGDVRDLTRLKRAFDGVDAVVHAAALKRVEVGEYCPDEMVRTNVTGTINVIEACRSAGVGKAVLVSSDKACQPLNAYGASKLLAEKLFLAPQAPSPSLCVVRYGNVAGSTGSVIPSWHADLLAGRQPALTNPEMTRYWMSVAEAATLVLWALAELPHGAMAVPDLPAYDLGTLAAVCAGLWGWSVGFDILGAYPGEKTHETMICDAEREGFSRHGNYWVKGMPPGAETLGVSLTSDIARRIGLKQLSALVSNLSWEQTQACNPIK